MALKKIILLLLILFPIITNAKNINSELIEAVMNGNAEMVRSYIDKGADVNAGAVLRLAVEFRHIDIIRLLLEKGADINAMDERGITALMVASKQDYTEIVKLLIEKNADVNIKGDSCIEYVDIGVDQQAAIGVECRTALWHAKRRGYSETIKLLKDAGAKE